MKKRLAFVRRQWQLFNLALMFFTRLPVSQRLPYSDKRMNQANRYFSLVGIVVGGIVAVGYAGLSHYFSVEISLLLAMVTSVLLTGAFHEDGLADMADGIGGGYSVEQRLLIMKDSRLGTYGAVTLFLALGLKFYLLVALANAELVMIALISAYSLSRALAASLIINTPYVSDSEHSKSKPLAAKQSITELVTVLSIGFLPCVFLPWYFQHAGQLILIIIGSLAIFRYLYRRWLLARLTGFTGDCLGGAQQLSELLIYLVMVQHIARSGIG